jgi:hypothetical protein
LAKKPFGQTKPWPTSPGQKSLGKQKGRRKSRRPCFTEA